MIKNSLRPEEKNYIASPNKINSIDIKKIHKNNNLKILRPQQKIIISNNPRSKSKTPPPTLFDFNSRYNYKSLYPLLQATPKPTNHYRNPIQFFSLLNNNQSTATSIFNSNTNYSFKNYSSSFMPIPNLNTQFTNPPQSFSTFNNIQMPATSIYNSNTNYSFKNYSSSFMPIPNLNTQFTNPVQFNSSLNNNQMTAPILNFNPNYNQQNYNPQPIPTTVSNFSIPNTINPLPSMPPVAINSALDNGNFNCPIITPIVQNQNQDDLKKVITSTLDLLKYKFYGHISNTLKNDINSDSDPLGPIVLRNNIQANKAANISKHELKKRLIYSTLANKIDQINQKNEKALWNSVLRKLSTINESERNEADTAIYSLIELRNTMLNEMAPRDIDKDNNANLKIIMSFYEAFDIGTFNNLSLVYSKYLLNLTKIIRLREIIEKNALDSSQLKLVDAALASISYNFRGGLSLDDDATVIDLPDKNIDISDSKYCVNMPKAWPIFLNKPSINDVVQNDMGNCWILATIGSIIHKDPEYFKNIMKNNFDGTVDVKLYNFYSEKPKIYRVEKNSITFNKDVPISVINQSNAFWIDSICKAMLVNILKEYDSNTKVDLQSLDASDPFIFTNSIFGPFCSTHLPFYKKFKGVDNINDTITGIMKKVDETEGLYIILGTNEHETSYTGLTKAKSLITERDQCALTEENCKGPIFKKLLIKHYSASDYINTHNDFDVIDKYFTGLIDKVYKLKPIEANKDEQKILDLGKELPVDQSSRVFAQFFDTKDSMTVIAIKSTLLNIIYRYTKDPDNLRNIYNIFSERPYICDRSSAILLALLRLFVLKNCPYNMTYLTAENEVKYAFEYPQIPIFSKAVYNLSNYICDMEVKKGNELYKNSRIFTMPFKYVTEFYVDKAVLDNKVKEINEFINSSLNISDNSIDKYIDPSIEKHNTLARHYYTVYKKIIEISGDLAYSFLANKNDEDLLTLSYFIYHVGKNRQNLLKSSDSYESPLNLLISYIFEALLLASDFMDKLGYDTTHIQNYKLYNLKDEYIKNHPELDKIGKKLFDAIVADEGGEDSDISECY